MSLRDFSETTGKNVLETMETVFKRVSNATQASTNRVVEMIEQYGQRGANAIIGVGGDSDDAGDEQSEGQQQASQAKSSESLRLHENYQLPETSEPVCVLGKVYSAIHDREEIYRDVETRLLFTYRRNFSPIRGNGPTFDTGWGCMIRCGQMMLGQALMLTNLGREWRWTEPLDRIDNIDAGDDGLSADERAYYRILARFLDYKSCSMSLHQIALQGESEGKRLGDWFGPNTVAQVMCTLSHFDQLDNYALFIAMDSILRLDCVYERVYNNTSARVWRPLLLIVPLRLGLVELNPVYIPALKASLSLPSSVGIIGGKPDHALWFYGFIGDELLYHDPHTTQAALSVAGVCDDDPQMDCQRIAQLLLASAQRSTASFDDSSYHSRQIRRLAFRQMDPSLAIGFSCKTEQDFHDLCFMLRTQVLSELPTLFEICESTPEDWIKSPSTSQIYVPAVEKPGSSKQARESSPSTWNADDCSGEADEDSSFEMLG